MNMICYQCEQAAFGKGCQQQGNCGKEEKCAHMQNLLLAWCKHISVQAVQMRQQGNSSEIIDRFIVDALYSSMSNVNFSAKDISSKIQMAYRVQQLAEYLAVNRNTEFQASLEKDVSAPLEDLSAEEQNELVEQGKAYSYDIRQKEYGETTVGFQEMILDGVKGAASNVRLFLPYLKRFMHGKENDVENLRLDLAGLKSDSKNKQKRLDLQQKLEEYEKGLARLWEKFRLVFDGIYEILAFLSGEPSDQEALMANAMKAGKTNFLAMELLELVRSSKYGESSPTVVRLSPIPGKCVLVSGNDYSDLYELLVQTEFSGIKVYTHGEMLSAHAYNQFRSFKHFCGHYGTSWALQQKEFDSFPGAILMTSGPMMKPESSYQDYIFTTGPVYFPGVKRIEADERGWKDFLPLIKAATDSPGFFRSKSSDRLTAGYNSNAVIGLFDQFRKALQQKQFRGFYLIAGSDGPGKERDYYADLVAQIPNDAVVLTFGSTKFRFNKILLEPLANGLPRLYDLGQINDAWEAIHLIKTYCEEFGCGLENIPLTIYLSWYGQRSIAVLLSFLSEGFRGINFGPMRPAFMNEELWGLFENQFGLKLAPVAEEEESN